MKHSPISLRSLLIQRMAMNFFNCYFLSRQWFGVLKEGVFAKDHCVANIEDTKLLPDTMASCHHPSDKIKGRKDY